MQKTVKNGALIGFLLIINVVQARKIYISKEDNTPVYIEGRTRTGMGELTSGDLFYKTTITDSGELQEIMGATGNLPLSQANVFTFCRVSGDTRVCNKQQNYFGDEVRVWQEFEGDPAGAKDAVIFIKNSPANPDVPISAANYSLRDLPKLRKNLYQRSLSAQEKTYEDAVLERFLAEGVNDDFYNAIREQRAIAQESTQYGDAQASAAQQRLEQEAKDQKIKVYIQNNTGHQLKINGFLPNGVFAYSVSNFGSGELPETATGSNLKDLGNLIFIYQDDQNVSSLAFPLARPEDYYSFRDTSNSDPLANRYAQKIIVTPPASVGRPIQAAGASYTIADQSAVIKDQATAAYPALRPGIQQQNQILNDRYNQLAGLQTTFNTARDNGNALLDSLGGDTAKKSGDLVKAHDEYMVAIKAAQKMDENAKAAQTAVQAGAQDTQGYVNKLTTAASAALSTANALGNRALTEWNNFLAATKTVVKGLNEAVANALATIPTPLVADKIADADTAYNQALSKQEEMSTAVGYMKPVVAFTIGAQAKYMDGNDGVDALLQQAKTTVAAAKTTIDQARPKQESQPSAGGSGTTSGTGSVGGPDTTAGSGAGTSTGTEKSTGSAGTGSTSGTESAGAGTGTSAGTQPSTSGTGTGTIGTESKGNTGTTSGTGSSGGTGTSTGTDKGTGSGTETSTGGTGTGTTSGTGSTGGTGTSTGTETSTGGTGTGVTPVIPPVVVDTRVKTKAEQAALDKFKAAEIVDQKAEKAVSDAQDKLNNVEKGQAAEAVRLQGLANDAQVAAKTNYDNAVTKVKELKPNILALGKKVIAAQQAQRAAVTADKKATTPATQEALSKANQAVIDAKGLFDAAKLEGSKADAKVLEMRKLLTEANQALAKAIANANKETADVTQLEKRIAQLNLVATKTAAAKQAAQKAAEAATQKAISAAPKAGVAQ